MSVIYIPVFESGRRNILEIRPHYSCFMDSSDHHKIFIDGSHYDESQLYKTRDAAERYWAKKYNPPEAHYTVKELVEAWRGGKHNV